MNQKSLDKNKTKELDWEKKLENILGNRKDIIDKLVGKIPDEQVIESLKYFDETKRQLDELISALLTQQRTELLEEIKDEMNKQTFLNPDNSVVDDYVLEQFTNLLNKKDD